MNDPQITIGMEARKIPVTTYRDGFFWRCWECGWIGTNCYSDTQALQEAGKHWDEEHPLLARPVVERVDMRKLVVPDEREQPHG